MQNDEAAAQEPQVWYHYSGIHDSTCYDMDIV
jgi:hypothetical protein